jgi:hypothetical protein
MDGVSHSVDVTAATPYEAVAQGLVAIQKSDRVVVFLEGVLNLRVKGSEWGKAQLFARCNGTCTGRHNTFLRA